MNVSVSLIPEEEKATPKPKWQPSEKEKAFLKRKMKRIDLLWREHSKNAEEIKEGLRLYEAKSTDLTTDSRDVTDVMPTARIFVEAKTADEVKVMGGFEFRPKPGTEGASDWKVEILKDIYHHVENVTGLRYKRSEMIRMKNAGGWSVGRVGYRRIFRNVKERIPTNTDALNDTHEKRLVPMYDDLFIDIYSPLDVAVDPKATSFNDATDCACRTVYTKEEAYEIFGYDEETTTQLDPRFKNVDMVMPGLKFWMSPDGQYVYTSGVPDDGIVAEEYFSKTLDEWVILLNGVLITDIDNPLPDDHKDLPFFSYHNSTAYAEALISPPTKDSQGKDASIVSTITGKRGFYTRGDPIVLKPSIDAETGLLRSLLRNQKLASEHIVATADSYPIPANKKWRTGDPLVGGKDKIQVIRFAESNFPEIAPILDYLFSRNVLVTGCDPRKLNAEQKARTATDASIIAETAAARLMENVEFNRECGETRLGRLLGMLIQQYYSIPEVVRLSSDATKEELKKFDEVQDGIVDGVYKRYGKRMRRIPSKKKFSETQKGEKFYLTEAEDGPESFLARPEWIRASDMFVEVVSTSRLGELQAVRAQQAMEGINMIAQIYQLAMPGPNGSPPVVKVDELPPLKDLIENYFKAINQPISPTSTEKDDTPQEQKDAETYMDARKEKILSSATSAPPNAPIPSQ